MAKYVVFGPPAVGKSSFLGRVATAVGRGVIRAKLTVVDLESFYDPEDHKKQTQYQQVIDLARDRTIFGGGACDPLTDLGVNVLRCFLLPPFEAYMARYDYKAKVRGVGTGKYHTRDGATRIYKIFEGMADEGVGDRFYDEETLLRFICKTEVIDCFV